MTDLAAAVPMASARRPSARVIGLWAAAGLLALGVHAAVGYGMQRFSMANMDDGGPPPAVAIDMAPLMIAPASPDDTEADVVKPDEPNPIEEVVEAKPLEPEVDKPEQVTEEAEAVQPEEAEPIETAAAVQPDQPPPLEEIVPDIVPAIAPDVVIPLPEAKPVEEKPVEKAKKAIEKPKPKPKKEKKEKAAPQKTVVSASTNAKPAQQVAGPKATEGSSRAGAARDWNSKVTSWINRHKRYPSAAQRKGIEGTAYVAFTVDSSGRVLSAKLARSSGNPDLDRGALATLQGATVPALPPELGARQSRTAPFVFNLRK